MTAAPAMLAVRGLSVRYGAAEILRDVSFSLDAGTWLMIAGPNGAGKSTIVKAIAQGVPYDGRIEWRGRDLRRMRPRELARHIGVLSQIHTVQYAFTVGEVVRLGCYARSGGPLSGDRGEASRERVERALRVTGLTELAGQSILTLSGGELQRVFLAQLFAQDPALMILDEPANHLDMVYQKQIFALLGDWLRQGDRAVVTVVHDLSLALAYGTRALLLDHGAAAAAGDVREVLSPEHLERVYGMDVHAWMRRLLGQWTAGPQ